MYKLSEQLFPGGYYGKNWLSLGEYVQRKLENHIMTLDHIPILVPEELKTKLSKVCDPDDPRLQDLWDWYFGKYHKTGSLRIFDEFINYELSKKFAESNIKTHTRIQDLHKDLLLSFTKMKFKNHSFTLEGVELDHIPYLIAINNELGLELDLTYKFTKSKVIKLLNQLASLEEVDLMNLLISAQDPSRFDWPTIFRIYPRLRIIQQ